MDNTKTGCFIKEVRTQKGMTQKELAGLLHVTDRAVSKWERGQCAPDIALLEPLSEALGVSIVELLQGERLAPGEQAEEAEARAKRLLGYSRQELRRKLRAFRAKYAAAAACLAALILLGGLLLWRGGYFSVVDTRPSPDGTAAVTVYGRDIYGSAILPQPAVSLRVKRPDGAEIRISYGECTYQGLWWAPDGKKYVLSLRYGEQTRLALAWLERNSESNLSACLSMGLGASELARYGLPSGGDPFAPEIQYQFLQWSADSSAMLLYCSFSDAAGVPRSGYFWYDCETGQCRAPFELEQPR